MNISNVVIKTEAMSEWQKYLNWTILTLAKGLGIMDVEFFQKMQAWSWQAGHRVCPAPAASRESYSFRLPTAFGNGRSTKSAASSASLRSVLRGVPISARMVRRHEQNP